jgi:hypothetical protein
MIVLQKFWTAITDFIVSFVCFATTGACYSFTFMSLDVDACLQGLRESYRISPRGSFAEDDDEGDDGNHVSGDGETLESMSEIEEHLLQLLERDKLLDDKSAEEKARRCSTIRKPQPFALSHEAHAFPCKDTYSNLPSYPTRWPQCPVMIRPTPYTSTKVRGIRRAKAREYEHFPGFCAGCILPVNNGSEKDGEGIVIDFESSHFVGTLLLRIKNAPESELASYQEKSYFDGKKRRFQGKSRW